MTSRDQGEAAGTPDAPEVLDVLREVWSARGQAGVPGEDCGPGKPCRNMAGVGFDGLADDYTDVRTAWRARLHREGKLNTDGGSLRDLVLGAPESG